MSDTITQAEIQLAQKLGRILANPPNKYDKKLTTNQLRKFLSSVNRLRMMAQSHDEAYFNQVLKPQILMLQPRLIYQLSKAFNRLPDNIQQFQNETLRLLKAGENNRTAFLKFCDFMEALIAYHKKEGGE